MGKNVLVTVLDSLNYTTMPYNEFVLFREKKYPNEEQVVLLTGTEILIAEKDIPVSLRIYRVGKNPLKIRNSLKKIIQDCKANNKGLVVHFHSIRGSFSTIFAMVGVLSLSCTLYTIHSTFTGYKLHNKILSFINSLFANYTTCVSNTSYNNFPMVLRKVKKERITAIQNGVNVERVDSDIKNVKILQHNGILKFVYVARIIPLKNHKFLVDVLIELRQRNTNNLKFIFVGAETDANIIRNYAIENDVIDMIEFTGLIPRNQVYKILKQSDVYLSSSTLEGLPVSVLEGMYCGLPCILSNIPQHQEVARGCDSIVVLPFDAKVWAQKILEFQKLSIKEIRDMGNDCKKHVDTSFNLLIMHKKYDLIYNKIRKNFQ